MSSLSTQRKASSNNLIRPRGERRRTARWAQPMYASLSRRHVGQHRGQSGGRSLCRRLPAAGLLVQLLLSLSGTLSTHLSGRGAAVVTLRRRTGRQCRKSLAGFHRLAQLVRQQPEQRLAWVRNRWQKLLDGGDEAAGRGLLSDFMAENTRQMLGQMQQMLAELGDSGGSLLAPARTAATSQGKGTDG